MKKIIINADDLGLNPAVNSAIKSLATKKCLTSTSLMSFGKVEHDIISALQKVEIDIGLHLDFTSHMAHAWQHQHGYPAYHLASLIGKAWLRSLNSKDIAHAINYQLDQFETITNRVPVFIDGHQHVHQFPIIRDVLLVTVQQRQWQNPPYLRVTTLPRSGTFKFKEQIIAMLGSTHLNRMLGQSTLRANQAFGGIYNLKPHADLYQLWQRWLSDMPDSGGVIMCHPADSLVLNDSICSARVHEFEFLKSDAFRELLKKKENVTLCSWNEI